MLPLKKLVALPAFAGVMLARLSNSHGVVFAIDLSPGPGLALNLDANPYTPDQALGLSASNVRVPAAGNATGGEFGTGMTLDDVSELLSWDIAFASDFGFINLFGNVSNAQFHIGAVNFPAINTNGSVTVGIFGSLIPGSTPMTGRFTGSATLDPTQESQLLDNLFLNIHSSFAGGGEIRSQTIIVPEPSGVLFLALSPPVLAAGRRPPAPGRAPSLIAGPCAVSGIGGSPSGRHRIPVISGESGHSAACPPL